MINKKASVKAISYCSKLNNTKLGLSTSWVDCLDLLLDNKGYQYGVYTKKDNTIITLYNNKEIIEDFNIENEKAYDNKSHDWDWNLISKTLVEYIMKPKKRDTKKVVKKCKK